jgi:long-chain acyl-CoA synthetase
MHPAYNLGDLLDRSRPADKVALIDCVNRERPREYTHGEIDRLANAFARGLHARGLKRGDSVAILSANRAEFLIAYFGTLRAGLVSVPVNHKFPRETVEFVLRDCGARMVLCDSERRGLVPHDIAAVGFDDSGPQSYAALLDPGPFEAVHPNGDEIAMVLYTSGSSGRPKGVPLSHSAHLWSVKARLNNAGLDRHRLLVAAPLFHMNGLGTSKFVFAAHASVVLLPQFDAGPYIHAIGRFAVTWLTGVPTMLAMVLRENALLAATDVSTVKVVRMGSAPATQKLIDAVKAAFPGAAVSNVYGTTEAGAVMFGAHPDGRAKPDLALGWPLPGVEVRILNADGEEADEGVLYIRTPAMMRGYLNLPEKTRSVLSDDGWYCSGDLFRRDANGAYWFAGRADDMFVCGGENIFPGEVEAMLERHPDIVQSCVVPVPDELKHEKPFAFVIRRAGSALDEASVKRYALEHAPAYQHPRRVVFLDEFPLAGTDKIDRKALADLARSHWQAAAAEA